eukprot:scaffold24.g2954.t1
MSFKFKVKIGGGGGGPAQLSGRPPQPPGDAPLQQQPPPPPDPTSLAAGAPAAVGTGPAPGGAKPAFKFKVKLPPQQPQQPQQPWPPDAGGPMRPPALPPRVPAVAAPKRPRDVAAGGAALHKPKKIKLAGSLPLVAAPGGGPPAAAKPTIKLKVKSGLLAGPLPPKVPAAGAARRAAAAGGGAPAPTLPIVRLTLPPGAAAAPPPLRKAPKGAKAAKAAQLRAGGSKKKLAGRGKGGGGGSIAAGRAKRAKREAPVRIQDLDEEDEEDEEEKYYESLAPTVHREYALRGSRADLAGQAGEGGAGLGGGLGAAKKRPTAALEPGLGEPLRKKAPALPPKALGPPGKADFERAVTRCQKKDTHNLFKEPVTESVAPGYFAIITQPMDFTAIRAKVEAEEYKTWEELRADMRLMFDNALTYNQEGETVWNYAKLLKSQCEKILDLAEQGKVNLRSIGASITRKHNMQVKAQEKARKEALRAQARAETKAAQEAKVLKKAGVASTYDEGEEESARMAYRRRPREPYIRKFGGLGAGANGEGVPVAWGPPVLRPSAGAPPLGAYAASLARFAGGLRGKARELVLARAAATALVPDEGTLAALARQLDKKVPLLPKPQIAPPAPVAPAGAGALGAAAGRPGVPVAAPGLAGVPLAMRSAAQAGPVAVAAPGARFPGMLVGGGAPGGGVPGQPPRPVLMPPGTLVPVLVPQPGGGHQVILMPAAMLPPGMVQQQVAQQQRAAAAAGAAGGLAPRAAGLPVGLRPNPIAGLPARPPPAGLR